jgi:hypothetical protein
LGVKGKDIYMGVKSHSIEGGKILGNENFELGNDKSNFRGGKNVYGGGKQET